MEAKDGKLHDLHPDLALLLSTSGTTGSSKMVRISYDNLYENTCSIIDYLKISELERPITVLPMCYAYGLSIINTHIMAGADNHCNNEIYNTKRILGYFVIL